MTQSAKICIAYTGKAVDDGSMDVNDLAPALLALGNLVGSANRVLNHDDSIVEVKLSAHFERGSFEMTLELVRTLTDKIKLFFADADYSINDIIGIIGFVSTVSGANAVSLVQFIRWLKNRRIKKIETASKDTVRVILDEDSREISIGAWNLYRSKEIHNHIEGVIAPLKHEGVDGFEVRDGNNRETIERIDKDSTEYFSTATLDEHVEEISSTQEIILKIVNVSFERNLKWRFDDGESRFAADVKDEQFLKAIDSGNISFAQGDALLAELQTVQQYTKSELKKTVKTVVKVLKVIKRDSSVEITIHSLDNDS